MRIIKNMTTRQKHWFFFSLTAIGSIVIVNLFILLMWTDMSPEEQKFGLDVFGRVVVYGTLAMAVVFLICSQFILYIFRNYISPVEKLTEETRLISLANAKYRIKPVGAMETTKLTSAINDLADAYIELKTDVKKIVTSSRKGFNEEKRRLETLMSQLPEGVIVCNYDGRILSYNLNALKMFNGNSLENGKEESGILGKGRSIFGICNRNPIIYALNHIQDKFEEGEKYPVFKFVSTRHGKQFLKINMATIVGEREGDYTITGYVLTIKDITEEIKAKSRKDIFLQSLTLGLQRELENIDESTQSIKSNDKLKKESGNELEEIQKSIDTLTEQINNVAVQHSDRLKEEGEKEYILAEEFIAILKEDIKAQFDLGVQSQMEKGLWLTIESYSIIRGVMYLLGQLTKQIKIDKIQLRLLQNNGEAYLKVKWKGEAIEEARILEWKQCPLMTKAQKLQTYSFESMQIEKSPLGNSDKVNSVRFNLQAHKPKSSWLIKKVKESRPLYYDLNIFENSGIPSHLKDKPLKDLTYVVFDTETTGLDPTGGDEIISLAGIRIYNGKIQEEEVFDQLVNPKRSIPLDSLKVHGIHPEMLRDKPLIHEVLPAFHKFSENAVLVAHNAAFDMKFLQLKEEETGVRFNNPVLDTLLLSAVCHPKRDVHNLEEIAALCDLEVLGRHTALGDAILTAEVFIKLLPILEANGIHTLNDAFKASMKTPYSEISF